MKTAALNGRHLAKVVPAGLCSGPVLMLRGRRDNGAGPVVMLNQGVLSLVGSRRNFCDLNANFIFKYDIMDFGVIPPFLFVGRGANSCKPIVAWFFRLHSAIVYYAVPCCQPQLISSKIQGTTGRYNENDSSHS